MRVLILTAALAFCVAPLNALAKTGAELLRSCEFAIKIWEDGSTDPDDVEQASFCAGYVSGFMDGNAMAAHASGKAAGICFPPNGLNGGKAVKIFMKYAKANPQYLDKSARGVLFTSLSEAYPCPQ